MILKTAIDSSNNIINGICNAIVKAERDTQFKATIKSEHLAQLQQLLNQAAKAWKTVLENHHSEQMKMLTEHESNMRKLLRRNEGVWFSDFWMKVLVIFCSFIQWHWGWLYIMPDEVSCRDAIQYGRF